MIPFILRKTLSQNNFHSYLQEANKTNQFSNGGWAVQELERRARDMLKIDDDKAVIATSSGTTALHAMLWAIQRQDGSQRIGTQDFTFASNSLGPAQGPIVTDMRTDFNLNLDDEFIQVAKLLIVTNIFGHVQDFNYISKYNFPYIIFDNAATPYSFWEGTNSCNLGTGSYVSLHHTKPLGFGEGGLAIIDKKYEEQTRIACNFGIVGGKFNERSGNYKMSDISAAAILQWWDQFDIDDLKEKYLDNYYKILYELREEEGTAWQNYGDEENFFPSCLPYVHQTTIRIEDNTTNYEARKYYNPLREFTVSSQLYNRILCYALTEGIEKCLKK